MQQILFYNVIQGLSRSRLGWAVKNKTKVPFSIVTVPSINTRGINYVSDKRSSGTMPLSEFAGIFDPVLFLSCKVEYTRPRAKCLVLQCRQRPPVRLSHELRGCVGKRRSGAYRMLVGKRVGVGINPMPPS